jgi:hypothetical protein
MELSLDCTWNNKKKKAKVVIVFEKKPESIFCLSDEIFLSLLNLEKKFLLDGPKTLEEFEKISKENPKSLYAKISFFNALRSFEFFEEALKLFEEIKKEFPKEVFTKSIEAHYFLENFQEEKFLKILPYEVLKAVFPKRSIFYYKEALSFHSAWFGYFSIKKNQIQAQKHANMSNVIINTLKSFSMAFQN